MAQVAFVPVIAIAQRKAQASASPATLARWLRLQAHKLQAHPAPSPAAWDAWHYETTVDPFAFCDELVDDAVALLRAMPQWPALRAALAVRFGLGAGHPVILLGSE